MNALPESWLHTKLGSVIEYGDTAKAEPSEIDGESWLLELEDIEKDTSRLLTRISFNERQSKSTKNRFESGDVLYGKLRPYLNKVMIADNLGYCTTEIIPLKAGQHLDNRYLFYWLKHPMFLDYVEAESHGLNMPRLGTDTGRAAPFILAPLNEQKRIADKLDAVLARVDACRDRLDRIPAILKRFRQSVLTSAADRSLIHDTEEFCASWKKKPLDQVAEFISGFAFKSEWFSSKGDFQVLKIANVKNGFIDIAAAPSFISQTIANQFAKFKAISEDILISMTGTKYKKDYGYVGLFLFQKDAFVNQRVGIIRANRNEVLPKYLAIYLQSNDFRDQFFDGETGQVNQGNVGAGHIKSCLIAYPDIQTQTEIVRRVGSLFAYADRLEARYTAARAQVEKLTPSLLTKAFRGELVPQDPNDEPASELLELIGVQRDEQNASSKNRNTGRKRVKQMDGVKL
jgi:type I restriction enzyme, S subunit